MVVIGDATVRIGDKDGSGQGTKQLADLLLALAQPFLSLLALRNVLNDDWLKDACKEAGVRYHMPKEAGRHAFVTKNLEEGKSLKWVQDSGRWKTLKIVAEKYGHLEKQEIDRQARHAGEEWFRKVLNQPLKIEGNATESRPKLGDGKGDVRKKQA